MAAAFGRWLNHGNGVKSYLNNSDLTTGLASWQKSIVDYGNQLGFTVNGS